MLMVLVQQEGSRMLYGKMKSPIGDLTLVGSGDQLEMIGFPEEKVMIQCNLVAARIRRLEM